MNLNRLDHRRARTLWWPSLFCALFSLGAQPAMAEGVQLRFETISIEQGLSQATVNCLVQDRDGFLWIGTQGGLNRFDGYDMKVFKHGSSALSEDWITALVESQDGLWIGTKAGGVNWLPRESTDFTNFRHDPNRQESLSGDRILALLVDRNDSIWVGTAQSGLSRLNRTRDEFQRFRKGSTANSLAGDRARSLLEDSDGKIWIGTSEGLNRLDPATGHIERIPLTSVSEDTNDFEIMALLQDRDSLWIGTRTGLIRLNMQTYQSQQAHEGVGADALNHSWVRALLRDRQDRLWIGTDGGLNWIDLSTTETGPLPIQSPEGLPSDQLVSITEDRSGNIWLGTVGEGVRKWNPRSVSFRHYSNLSTSEEIHNNVFGISEDRSGDLWIGSYGGGVVRLNNRRITNEQWTHDPADPKSLIENRVTALLHDSAGNLWVGTVSEGLDQRPPSGRGFDHHRHDPDRSDSLSYNSITALFEDSQHRLWIGTFGGGLNRHVAGDRFEAFIHDSDTPSSISSNRIMAIENGPSGNIWLATDGGGLNLFNPSEGVARHWRHSETSARGPSSNEVTALHSDSRGRLWIGTKGRGLDLIEDQESHSDFVFSNYSESDGLPDATVWGIESDLKDRIWLATTNGLVRFDPEQEDFKIFDTSHGLQSKEFNLGAHFKSPSGELFFGGINGVNAFFPEQIRDNTVPPNVVLTGFTKLNEPVDLGVPLTAVEHIDLDHSDHFLTFEFAALDFTAPEKNKYRYQLGGFEKEDRWIDMSDRRLQFADFRPGNFTLRVQGSNSDGVWSPVGKEITLAVAPPLWRTWWFRSLLLLFAAATAGGAHQLKIHRIRVNNERLAALVKERTRELEDAQERLVRKEKLAVLGELSGSVAHELRNPLGIIKNSIYFLRLTQKMVDDKAKEHLGLIDREIKRSDRIIGELLDYAKEPTAQTEPVTATQVVDSALELLEIPDAVELVYDPDSFHDADGSPWQLQVDHGQIERVLGNLITNAFQAMPDGGTLTLEGQGGESEVHLQVRDTGVGIEEDDLKKIFEPLFTRKIYGIGLGLPLSLRYVQMNGGELKCESRLGEGTTFHLRLPRVAAKTPAP